MATLTTLIGFNGADGASPFDSFTPRLTATCSGRQQAGPAERFGVSGYHASAAFTIWNANNLAKERAQ
jgi:hypothetical protein